VTSVTSTAMARAQRQIIAAIAVGAALNGLLSDITRVAARLCHSNMALVTLLTDSGKELEVVGVHGVRARILGARLPIAASFNGLVITTGRSVGSTDVLHDARPLVRRTPFLAGARGVFAVPLPSPDGPFGSLGVAKQTVWRFTDRDAAMLTQLAASASVAIQNARLRGRVQSAGARAPGFAREFAPMGRVPAGGEVRGDGAEAPAGSGTGDRIQLTPRQREIVILLAAGLTCAEAAAALDLSSRTVQHHLERLKQRFRQPRLPALVGYLMQHGVGASVPRDRR
jgi:DNA-binding CsgD family transcriptional regulator